MQIYSNVELPRYARTFKHKHTHTHTSTGWLRSFYFSPCAFLRHFFCCTKCSTPTAKRAMERIKISQYFGSPSKLKCCYSHKLFDNKRKQHENAICFSGTEFDVLRTSVLLWFCILVKVKADYIITTLHWHKTVIHFSLPLVAQYFCCFCGLFFFSFSLSLTFLTKNTVRRAVGIIVFIS